MVDDNDYERRKDRAVSRRNLLETTARTLGAAALVVTSRAALARPDDVSLDSSGKVLIDGNPVPGQPAAGTRIAQSNVGCINHGCKKPTKTTKPPK